MGQWSLNTLVKWCHLVAKYQSPLSFFGINLTHNWLNFSSLILSSKPLPLQVAQQLVVHKFYWPKLTFSQFWTLPGDYYSVVNCKYQNAERDFVAEKYFQSCLTTFLFLQGYQYSKTQLIHTIHSLSNQTVVNHFP